jgi:hypothetical protein
MERPMPDTATLKTSLFEVTEEGEKLVVRTLTAAYRSVLTMLTWLVCAATIVLIGYLLAVRQSQGYWWIAPVPLFIVLFLYARAAELRSAAHEQTFGFDRKDKRFTRNGEMVAAIPHIDHVLVREVVEENRPPRHFALVVEMDDTRRTLMAESVDLPDGREQMETVGRRIADFIGVPLQYGQRHPDETWIDR